MPQEGFRQGWATLAGNEFHRYRLEPELQSELQLPRRTRISRREASAGDGGERGRHRPCRRRNGDDGRAVPRDGAGLAKVRVIEEIECVQPELQVHSLRELGVFDKREVDISEARAVNGVAAQVAEVPRSGHTIRRRSR